MATGRTSNNKGFQDCHGKVEKDCGKESFHVPDDMENGFCKASDVSVSAMFIKAIHNLVLHT